MALRTAPRTWNPPLKERSADEVVEYETTVKLFVEESPSEWISCAVVYLYDRRYLFTGDSLSWSFEQKDLRAFRTYCWNWREQMASLERLLAHRFEWVLAGHGGRALDASRGEPAFVFELGERTLAVVLEGLGTKSLIARAVLEQQGLNRFADVAYDAVAAILNDLACVGAVPLVVNAYFATGDSRWYEHRDRATALLEGWRRAYSISDRQ